MLPAGQTICDGWAFAWSPSCLAAAFVSLKARPHGGGHLNGCKQKQRFKGIGSAAALVGAAGVFAGAGSRAGVRAARRNAERRCPRDLQGQPVRAVVRLGAHPPDPCPDPQANAETHSEADPCPDPQAGGLS